MRVLVVRTGYRCLEFCLWSWPDFLLESWLCHLFAGGLWARYLTFELSFYCPPDGYHKAWLSGKLCRFNKRMFVECLAKCLTLSKCSLNVSCNNYFYQLPVGFLANPVLKLRLEKPCALQRVKGVISWLAFPACPDVLVPLTLDPSRIQSLLVSQLWPGEDRQCQALWMQEVFVLTMDCSSKSHWQNLLPGGHQNS